MKEGRRSHLYNYHQAHGEMVSFAGFEMPLWFKGIREEHMAVRTAAGLFDVSHMGRFELRGPDSTRFLSYLVPTDLRKVTPRRCFYSVILNEKGGIVDDTVTLRLGEDHYLMTVNAANREKDFSYLSQEAPNFDVQLTNVSDDIAMLALQGPRAEEILQRAVDIPLSEVTRYSNASGRFDGLDVHISRTGYTGEDGFEIYVLDCPLSSPEKAEQVWDRILSLGEPVGILPCGLGARDTLRLEAGMCLYGQDMDEDTTPLEARLGWLVSFEKGDYRGRRVLEAQKERGVERIRTGFIMKERGIPRPHYNILREGEVIGRVTSGTFSPLLKKGIAMGYIPKRFDVPGEGVEIDIRGSLCEAEVKRPPFYDTKMYGYRRQR